MINVVDWAQSTWIVPETRRRIVLKEWQKRFLLAAFPPDGAPSDYETFLISTVKKAGKTETNAIAVLFAALTRPGPETIFTVANDLMQSRDRVFSRILVQLRLSGMLDRGEVRATKSELAFRDNGTLIQALAADAAGSAGAIFGVSSWTELWAYEHESHTRLYEEMTPIPGRHSLRIIDSYAGFTGAAPILEPLWTRAIAGDPADPELPIYTTGRLWAYVDTGEEAQRRCWLGDPAGREPYYAEQRRSLRPGTFARLHENAWQSSAETFVTSEEWDATTWPNLTAIWRPPAEIPCFVGIDIGLKSDCSSVVTVIWDPDAAPGQRRLQVIDVEVWRNTPGRVLDLFDTVVPYLRELAERCALRRLLFDPSQFHAAAQVLSSAMPVCGVGVYSTREDDLAQSHETMMELPQTLPNLTKATQALWSLVKTGQLITYPEPTLRQHVLNAVAIESAQGLRLAKEKQSRKIDAAVALSFACLAAVTFPPDPGREPAAVQTLVARGLASGAPMFGSPFGA